MRCNREAFEFFRDHAGYATPPGRMACAKELAEAEAKARRDGLRFDWEPDPEPAEYQDERGNWHEADAMGCRLMVRCGKCGSERCGGSLWGIMESHNLGEMLDYRRVIEAELAAEYYANLGR